jgi:hypothetical protein
VFGKFPLIAKERNMPTSWTKRAEQFKSPLKVVAGFLLRSRETQARRAKERTQEIRELKRELEQKEKTIAALREQRVDEARKIAHLKVENEQLRGQLAAITDDPPLPKHEFGPKMISLAINCARTVGLRASERVLQLVRDWLNIEIRIPTWSTIRTWLLRAGIAKIADPATFEQSDDVIWLADHSNQIGAERVLSVLATRASEMPPPGQALRHEDMEVLYAEPGTQWKQEDVAKVYLELEKAFGTPRGILTDGATELQNAAKHLENKGEINSDVFRDLKHIAANILKAELGKDARFKEFTAMLGQTRSSIQQTELGHLTPPEKKAKARFMNLAGNLKWAEMVLWGLKHPEATLRREITKERMEEKLGWLRGFQEELIRWSECQRIVSVAVKFAAEQGVSMGATEALQAEIGEVLPVESAQRVKTRLLAFMKETEAKLQPGERLPISTEILESTFGRYKALERQHSYGGFTSLIAALPALLHPVSPAQVKTMFAKVTNKTVRNWIKAKLGQTLTSKRNAAYAEYKKSIKRATMATATG